MDIPLMINLLLVVLLIALTAFFVGAEFAVVKVRISRLDQLITEGNKQAVIAKKVVDDLDYYLSACQLGITVTALGLGFLGEPTIQRMLHPIFADLGVPTTFSTVISLVLALSIMTYLHVVVGELAPKTLAIQFSEKLTLMLAPPLYWFGKVMSPFIWILNGSARFLIRVLGIKLTKQEEAHSEDELKIIMAQSYKSGEINQAELSYVENVFTFDERVAKDIMVPRTQMITLSLTLDSEEILAVLDQYQFTRYPVTENGDKDAILGYVNVKRMLTDQLANRDKPLKESLQKITHIHEITPLRDVLVNMQKERVHIALVNDEYGGTAGIITMEDILEEIVGEIRDEFDINEIPDIEQKSEEEFHINGRVLLSDLEERFGLSFDESVEVDTIGGWIQFKNMDVTEKDTIEHGNHIFTVLDMKNYQILKVALHLNGINQKS